MTLRKLGIGIFLGLWLLTIRGAITHNTCLFLSHLESICHSASWWSLNHGWQWSLLYGIVHTTSRPQTFISQLVLNWLIGIVNYLLHLSVHSAKGHRSSNRCWHPSKPMGSSDDYTVSNHNNYYRTFAHSFLQWQRQTEQDLNSQLFWKSLSNHALEPYLQKDLFSHKCCNINHLNYMG